MLERVRAWLHTSDIRAYPLYSSTIFLSAFLLFQVQPMVGRFLLPFFGGATSVWAASLVFFTGVLFLGYLYVYTISSFDGKKQTFIHSILLAVAALAVLGTLLFADSTYPSFMWVFDSTNAPALQVLLALGVCIGIPYFLLSTTGPLLQQWYAKETKKEPYHLYALSNVGSLLALVTYPFVTEPLFGLSTQQLLWSILFLLCVALLVMTARSYRAVHTAAERVEETAVEAVPMSRLLAWLALAALPSIMLVATTARITQVIAPVPFIWVVPLALYLLSFIFAFRGVGGAGLTPFIVLIAAFASYTYMDWSFATVPYQIISNLALFFFGALYCHALLYKLRPEARLSSFYYVWLSLGGAAGTLLIALVAPVIFADLVEFPWGVMLLASLAIIGFPSIKYIRDEYYKQTRVFKVALLVVIVTMTGQYFQTREDDALEISRNFFGVVRVYEYGSVRSLHHGTTLHGTQSFAEGEEKLASTYYTPTSGVGRAIVNAKVAAERAKRPVAVGTIGLGAGTIASYCEDDDKFVFYEIDKRVGRIANQYFTYLANCPKSEVHYGDGRLVLKEELENGKPGGYDVLAIDAFSDDTVPVHLLTKEAVELYIKHLRSPQGIIAIHTSNRFLELAPIVMRVAYELDLSAMTINDVPEDPAGSSSQWVLLSPDVETLQQKVFSSVASEPYGDAPLWTDNFANVFSALDLNALRLWTNE